MGSEDFTGFYFVNDEFGTRDSEPGTRDTDSGSRFPDHVRIMANSKIIVIGGGLSGLMSALKAAEKGAEVSVFSIVPVRRSHSVCAQGGINAALNTKGEGDSVETHIYDTVYGGDFLAHQSVVKRLCNAAPGIIYMFDRMGVMFNRTKEGLLDLRLFGGVKKRRTCFSGATTGQQLMYALDEQIRRHEAHGAVKKYENWEFASLVMDEEGVCRGIVAIDRDSLETRAFPADAVILCTGGFGHLYGTCTNSTHCTGTAATEVFKRGASFANPEFVQFHPTAIPGTDKMRLISEAARGEGGRIWVPRDGKPWYFLEEWYPAYGNTVPRDVASRAIWKVVKDMKLGVDGEDIVYLDLTHLDHEALAERLEGILEIYEKFVGEDPRKVPMKVFPAVHYSMGGVWVDFNHMSSIPGLFAAGECDYQYHGANRLGANSLLSAVHSGMIAGPASVKYANGLKKGIDAVASSVFENERREQQGINQKLMAMDGPENPHLLKQEMSKWLTENATIVRHNKTLKETDDKIREFAERFERACVHDRGSWANEELFFMRTLRNQFDLARLVLLAAINRDESRGSHYKPETPNRDDEKWLAITKATYTPEGPKFDYSEKVEILDIKPVARRYDVAH